MRSAIGFSIPTSFTSPLAFEQIKLKLMPLDGAPVLGFLVSVSVS
ncbi:MAG: hypothetical protein ACT4PI_05620 [Actinomycetota bacterium]